MARSVYQILIELENDKQAKQSLQDIGIAAGLTGTALLAFSAKAAEANRNYSFSLAKVDTLATAATGSTEEFDAMLGELAKSLDNNLSKTEAAAAAYDVLSAGITDIAEVNYILAESQKTAIGGFSDIATISDGTTTILNSYGEALGENLTLQEKVDKITNGMINTQNLGKITAGEYAALIGDVAASSASAGVSLEELNAIISVNTAKGADASTTVAALNQVYAAVAKPTAEAAKFAEELGIQFNATSLRTLGLAGFLKMLTEAGVDTNEELIQLFGSVEAANAILRVTGEGFNSFNDALVVQKENLNAVDDAYTKIADTDLQKAEAAMNAFKDALASVGTSAQVALTPALEAATSIISSMPEEVKESIGLLTTFGGVALNVTGGIALLATNIGTLITSTSAVTNFISLNIAQMKIWQLSMIASAKTSAVLNARLVTLMGTLGLITLAVAALVVGWKHWENIKTEDKNNELISLMQQTQLLADKAYAMGEAIRSTGKAIPDAEFEAFIALLEQADGGTGVLRQNIDALKRVQEKAKKSTEDSTKATQNQTGANQQAALSEEEKAKAIEAAIEANNDLQQTVETNYARQLAEAEAYATSTENLLERQNAAEEDRTEALKSALRARSNLEGINAAEKAQINERIAQLDAELLSKQKQNAEELIELKKSAAIETLAAERSLLEATDENNIGALRANSEARYNLEKKDINRRLELAEKGSVDADKLQAELLQNEATYQGELKQLKDKEKALIDEHNQRLAQLATDRYEEARNNVEREKALTESLYESGLMSFEQFTNSQIALAAKAYQAEQSYLEQRLTQEDLSARERSELLLQQTKGYAEYAAQLKSIDEARLAEALSTEKAITDNLTAQLQARQSSLQALGEYKDAITGAIGTFGSQLSTIQNALKDENTTTEQRNRLNQAGSRILSNLRSLGIEIKSNKLGELEVTKIQQQIELQKVTSQIEQLAIKRQQLALETSIQKQQLENEIQLNQVRLASGTLSESEAFEAQLAIDLSAQKLDGLRQEYDLKSKALDLDQKTLKTQQAISAAMAGQQVPESNRAVRPANPFRESSGGRSGVQIDPVALKPLAEAQRQGTDQLGAKLDQANQQQQQTTQQSLAQLELMRQTNSTLTGIKSDTARIISQLGNIWTVINGLPGRIGASIPRPSSPSTK